MSKNTMRIASITMLVLAATMLVLTVKPTANQLIAPKTKFPCPPSCGELNSEFPKPKLYASPAAHPVPVPIPWPTPATVVQQSPWNPMTVAILTGVRFGHEYLPDEAYLRKVAAEADARLFAVSYIQTDGGTIMVIKPHKPGSVQ